jgi:membrane protease YdiL (CAAX protease family)
MKTNSGQHLRNADPHGGVHIVSTQVGDLCAGPYLSVRRYRVHVCPVGDRPAATITGEDAHDPMPADPGGDVEARRAESSRHHRGGSLFLARDLGVPMKVAAHLDQATVQPRHHGVHRILIHHPGRRPVAGVRHPGRCQRGSRHANGGATEHSAPTDDSVLCVRHGRLHQARDCHPGKPDHTSLSRSPVGAQERYPAFRRWGYTTAPEKAPGPDCAWWCYLYRPRSRWRHMVEAMPNRSWWVSPWQTRGMGSSLGWGLALGFAVPAAITMVLDSAGAISLTRSADPVAAVAVTAVTAVVLTPVIEETLARYLLLRAVERLAGSWVAVAVTAVLFGAGHVLVAAANDSLPGALLYAAPGTLAGVLFAGAYLFTRTMWLPIALHAGWNLATNTVSVRTHSVPTA